jgi:hypothetical protein
MTFDIPNKDGQWIFTSPNTWQTWVKPTQYNNFIMYVCGGGGGGGKSQAGTSAAVVRGGGGGAGGVLQIINAASFLLPETLYFNIGLGGAGGNLTPFNGIAGGTTYVCYYPNTNAANVIFSSSGGNGGQAGQNGAAGGAASTPYTSQSIFSFSGTNSCAGVSSGLFTADTPDFSITTSSVYGGGGGGAVSASAAYKGGGMAASNIHPKLDGGELNLDGNNGYFIKKPFTALGGTGGGGGFAGTGGGIGGNGIMGSGGGGGGASTNSILKQGGKGGDGFVIIIGY